jgi:hypothetical protein
MQKYEAVQVTIGNVRYGMGLTRDLDERVAGAVSASVSRAAPA